ncbi:hypothetical protein [Bacillus cereus]|uniref:hypothetical protein n=1 Tax=Bacillus cereus TaxID=1396 RepID=UPI000BC022A9|nr:hypothetical protein [Bacillus cereus]ASZ69452.1 hypothetical protein CJ306_29880 [Bacillus cereus]
MDNLIYKTKALVNNNYSVDILHFSDSISVLDDLLIELGYEIQSSWEDGRIHIDSDGTLLEASIVNSQGEISIFLKITMQDLVRNAAETIPYFKKANPLSGADAGKYTIMIRATTMCVFLPNPHNYFLFSVTPIVKISVDCGNDPVIDKKYPLDCNLVGNETSEDQIVEAWPINYKEN